VKRLLQNSALFIGSWAVALIGIELALRLIGPEVLAADNPYVFYKFDPVLGWANLPGSHGFYQHAEFKNEISINADGMRDEPVEAKRPDEFRIAVLGDSFTWGLGASYGERFTEIIEAQNPRFNVLNFGVSGFGPIQYLLEIDRVLAMEPDFVLVAFCLSNDVRDNVQSNPYGYAKPYATLSADGASFEVRGYPLPESRGIGPAIKGTGSGLKLIGLLRMWIGDMRQRRSEVFPGITWRDFYLSGPNLDPKMQEKIDYGFKVNALLLDAMAKRVASELGPERFAVLLAPTQAELGVRSGIAATDGQNIGDRVLADLNRLEIAAIDGRGSVGTEDFWRYDPHWRPSGHRRIGLLLADFFAKRLSAPGPAVSIAP
jgi:hypothetical protein